MKKSIVLGMAFGDEGKGVTTQWLCLQAMRYNRKPIVCRFNGGAQAAHTIHYGENSHICSTYGSGVLVGAPTALSSDFFFDPILAYNEYKTLMQFNPTLFVSPECRVVTPYDVLFGQRDQKVREDGTCGKGIFKTFKRHLEGFFDFPFYTYDLIPKYLSSVCDYYGCERDEKLDNLFIESIKKLPFDILSGHVFSRYDEIVYEGAQGLLLDMDYGFFPNVTPSHTGLDNLKDITKANVYLITRTYLTRHGNGYTPEPCSFDTSNDYESNVFNEMQGHFKKGMLDLDLLQKAIDRHHLDVWQNKFDLQYHLYVTHGDTSIKNKETPYIYNGTPFRKKTETLDDVKNLFVDFISNSGIKFQSIRVNQSIYSNFN